MNDVPGRLTRRESLLGDGLLVLVTVIWGITFPLSQTLLKQIQPNAFVAIRFTLALALLLPVCGTRLLKLRKRDWQNALLLAALLFAGILFQNIGLPLTTSTNSAFLTALCVPLVPFAAIWLLKTTPPLSSWVGCGLALAGIMVLTVQPGMKIGPGDLITMGTAVVFAFEIVLVGKFLPGRDAVAITTAMAIFCAAFAWIGFAVMHESLPGAGLALSIPMLVIGVISGGGTLLAQNYGQQHTTAVHAAIIFSIEPIWAGMFSHYMNGDILGPRIWIGGAAILLGVVISELWP